MSHHPATFGGHRDCGSGDKMFLICHIILPDHVTTSHNFMAGILARLVAIGIVVLEIKRF